MLDCHLNYLCFFNAASPLKKEEKKTLKQNQYFSQEDTQKQNILRLLRKEGLTLSGVTRKYIIQCGRDKLTVTLLNY